MNKRQKLITDLVNSSRAYSGSSEVKPSLKDIAALYAINEDSTGELEDKYKKEFDGLDISEMEAKRFDRRLKNLSNRANVLEEVLDNKLPVVEEKNALKKDKPLDELFGTYTLTAEKEYSKAMTNYIQSLKRYFGYPTEQKLSIIDFPESSVKALHGPLIELGKISIKLRVMKEVETEIDLNGSYIFYKQFESVPSACEYFATKLGDSITRELLKNKIRKHARIYDKDSLIEDWSIINKRINSWVSHEGERYNKKPIPIK